MAYTTPLGEHGFYVANDCQNFSMDRYMVGLVARFFASGGKDLYYLSHPETHQCLAQQPGSGGCGFMLTP